MKKHVITLCPMIFFLSSNRNFTLTVMRLITHTLSPRYHTAKDHAKLHGNNLFV